MLKLCFYLLSFIGETGTYTGKLAYLQKLKLMATKRNPELLGHIPFKYDADVALQHASISMIFKIHFRLGDCVFHPTHGMGSL